MRRLAGARGAPERDGHRAASPLRVAAGLI
jgi:hypothetical protein